MRLISVIILIALSLSVMPQTVVVHPHAGTETSISVLNVCNGSGTGVLSSTDMPFVYECPCKLVPSSFAGFHDIANPVFNRFLVAFQKEHPPKV
jgi:hypothetical protein